jgi:hypothetical protein
MELTLCVCRKARVVFLRRVRRTARARCFTYLRPYPKLITFPLKKRRCQANATLAWTRAPREGRVTSSAKKVREDFRFRHRHSLLSLFPPSFFMPERHKRQSPRVSPHRSLSSSRVSGEVSTASSPPRHLILHVDLFDGPKKENLRKQSFFLPPAAPTRSHLSLPLFAGAGTEAQAFASVHDLVHFAIVSQPGRRCAPSPTLFLLPPPHPLHKTMTPRRRQLFGDWAALTHRTQGNSEATN